MLLGLTTGNKVQKDGRHDPMEQRRRAGLFGPAEKCLAAGSKVQILGRGSVAVTHVRTWLTGKQASPAREAALELLPELPTQLLCPACGTTRPPLPPHAYRGCANCGHGLIQRPIHDPYRCTTCGLLVDGKPPRQHRAFDNNGEPAALCRGDFRALPLLDFDVATTSSNICLLGTAGATARFRFLGATALEVQCSTG